MSANLSDAQLTWAKNFTGINVNIGGTPNAPGAGADGPGQAAGEAGEKQTAANGTANPPGANAPAPATGGTTPTQKAADGPPAAGLSDDQKKQFEAAMKERADAIKTMSDAGINVNTYDAEEKDLRSVYDTAGKTAKQEDRDKSFNDVLARAQNSAAAAKTDSARVKTSVVEDVSKAVQDMLAGTKKLIDKMGNDQKDDKAKLQGRLNDINAKIEKEAKLTDRRARAEQLKDINAEAEALFDDASKGDPDTVQEVYGKALKERYGIDIQMPANFKKTNLEMVYKMFDKVPATDVVQGKMKLLNYKPAAGSATYSNAKIEFNYASDGTEPTAATYTNPKTGAQEKPNWFKFTTLHELGHSIDDRFGVMRSNGAKPTCGGWNEETQQSVAKALIESLKGQTLAIAPNDLQALTVSALDTDINDKPANVSDADWTILQPFFRGIAPRRASASPWTTALPIGSGGDRSYHQAYGPADGNRWVSYLVSARAGRLSDYQFRAPLEWFAELYAYTWLNSAAPPSSVDNAVKAYLYGGKAATAAPTANH